MQSSLKAVLFPAIEPKEANQWGEMRWEYVLVLLQRWMDDIIGGDHHWIQSNVMDILISTDLVRINDSLGQVYSW